MDALDKLIDRVSHFILYGINADMSDKEFLEEAIMRWKGSPERVMQIKGFLYYDNEHDILSRKRTMIGADGKLQEVDNLPNNLIIDNQYAKLVNQKTNYLLGKPFVIDGADDAYKEALKDVFDKKFMRTMKRMGKYMYNGGITWLYPYYDAGSKLQFRLFPAYEILPFWKDAEHTQLEGAIRLYLVAGYDRNIPVVIEKVEVFTDTGVRKYILDGNKLIDDVTEDMPSESYVQWTKGDGVQEGLNWSRIPLIPIKYNESETPLLKKVKSLQDALNITLSDFENNMQEDARNTILVLTNYDGTDLGEFRRNLATYGAVKVRYDDSAKGGVETLTVEVNSDNYKAIEDLLKKAIIENGMGYDAKDEKMSGTPNQMNIQSMYSDIDIDANDTETELQASFDDILWFVNAYLADTGKGDFFDQDINIIFNRDILINETEAIQNCVASVGILSDETIVSQHPWVNDPQLELQKLEKQKQKEEEEADRNNPFAQIRQQNQNNNGEGDDDDDNT